MSIKTADLCDEHIETLQVAEDIFNDFGGRKTFNGEMVTVKVFEDNTLEFYSEHTLDNNFFNSLKDKLSHIKFK